MLPDDAVDQMLAVLTRPGWHGWEDIAEALGIERNPSLVLTVYHEIRERGYGTGLIEHKVVPGIGDRYRLTPQSRP